MSHPESDVTLHHQCSATFITSGILLWAKLACGAFRNYLTFQKSLVFACLLWLIWASVKIAPRPLSYRNRLRLQKKGKLIPLWCVLFVVWKQSRPTTVLCDSGKWVILAQIQKLNYFEILWWRTTMGAISYGVCISGVNIYAGMVL